MDQPRRVLVRAVNWLGDAVMTVPALKELRRLLPEARIDLVARAPVDALFAHAPYVDRVVRVRRGARALVALARGELRRERYDLALVLPNSFSSALLPFLAGVPLRAGYGGRGRALLLNRRARDRSAGLHQARRYLDLLTLTRLSALDYRDPAYVPAAGLDLSLDLAAIAADVLARLSIAGRRPLVAMHAGAAFGPAKRWPPARFGALADALVRERGASVVLVGGPGEEALAAEVAKACRTPLTLAVGRTTVVELVALLAAADLVVANDSGPMHLAGALGRPLVAIFGSTDPVATGPVGPASVVVREPVPCSPCFARDCPLGHLACLEGIAVDRVLSAALARL